MVCIKAFRALRPAPKLAEVIAAPPYDVPSAAETSRIVRDNPLSFLAIDEPIVHFPKGTDPGALEVYEKAGSLLRSQRENGFYVQDDQDRLYLYELTMDGRVQNGIVGCVAIDDYLNGIVKEHESTRVDKELDRVNHVRACGAQTGPIFLAYHSDEPISQICADAKEGESLFDFVDEMGVRHRGFGFSQSQIDSIIARFAQMDRAYIADGHHRVAAAAEVAKARRVARGEDADLTEADYFLAVLFADNELKIWPYNRVVRDLNGLDPDGFLDEVCRRFDVERIAPESKGESDESGTPFSIRKSADPVQAEELVKPHMRGEFCMFLDGSWYRCKTRKEDLTDDPHRGLTVTILQQHLLEPVLGIADPRRSPRISFVGGIRGLAELERLTDEGYAVAFAVAPTSIDELFAVADAGRHMPPKSTWFEPKLKSGLFIHEI